MAKIDGGSQARRVRVWDPATRLFHWALVGLVAVSLLTGEFGDNDTMDIHALVGFGVLTLVFFRMFWGIIGSRRSRFGDFVRGPRYVFDYAKKTLAGESPAFVGHNPLGGWSVVAILAALLGQGMTGLFANDDILFEGPLAAAVSKAFSDGLTEVHETIASVVMLLVVLHVAAVIAHWIKGENLILPMITGRKIRADGTGDFPFVSPFRAVLAFVLAAALVAVVVSG